MKLHWCVAFVLVFSALVVARQAPVSLEKEPHHHVLLKNESVLVVKVTLQPDEATLFHTHLHDRMIVVLKGTVTSRQELGKREAPLMLEMPGEVSAVESHGPYTHRVRNAGTTPYEAIDVEILHRPGQSPGPPAAVVAAENPSARAYEWTLQPGVATAMHTHERPYLIISRTPMMLKMRGPDGQSSTHEVTAGDFHWVDAKVTHTLENAST